MKKAKKKQLNTRVPEYLHEFIRVAALASGMTQAKFLEKCVTTNVDAVATLADDERAKLMVLAKKLQEDAKLND